MAVDEQTWRRAVQALANAIGEAEADALIGKFLEEPARREDLTGTEDRLDARISGVEERLDARISGVEERLDARISGVEERLDARISGVEQRLDARISSMAERLDGRLDATRELLEARVDQVGTRIDHSKDEVIAVVRGEINTQFRSMLFGFVGLQATIGAFVVGVLRFGA